MKENNYRVLLYYYFVDLPEYEQFAADHLEFCQKLGLKGRILVANYGINGTVSGTVEQTEEYMNVMRNDERFKDIVFKCDEHDGHAFKKMHVRPREELVTLRLEDPINPQELTGEYLSPQDFYKAMKAEDTVILDTRNDYEYDVGHFRGAIRPDIRSFRDLPQWVQENRHLLENKRILTYCTGGIRCEKVTGWLIEEGFPEVAQLEGGIVSYGKDSEVQGKLWDGVCYVFDERLTVPINRTEHVVVGKDYFDGTPCERYVNCAEPSCNKQILCSEENEHKYLRSCSDDCRRSPRNRYVNEHNLTDEEVNKRLVAIQDEKLETI